MFFILKNYVIITVATKKLASMQIKTIKKYTNLKGQRILLRADLNVPIKKGKILENFKLAASLPTIRYLLRYNAKIIIVTHLGRPEGKRVKQYSTKPIAEKLSKLLGQKVKYVNEAIGFKAEQEVYKMKNKDILLLENIRYYKEEKENNKKFAKRLARLADIYVNDSFGVDHRSDASLSAIKKYLPSYAGLLVEQEIINLTKILKPKKPLVVIIGGAKLETKLPLLLKIGKMAEHVLIGGKVANVFLSALGYPVGNSLGLKQDFKIKKEIKFYYQKTGNAKNILPLDVVVSTDSSGQQGIKIKKVSAVAKTDYIFDIGPETIKYYAKFIKKANTIIWNGAMGMFENKKFSYGTYAIARLVASRSTGQAFGVAGGGETIEALKITKMLPYIDWVSTGGGATLAFLSGGKMPGLQGLYKK